MATEDKHFTKTSNNLTPSHFNSVLTLMRFNSHAYDPRSQVVLPSCFPTTQ